MPVAGQEIRDDADVEEGLQRKMRGDPRGEQRAEAVTRVHGDIIAAHDEKNKEQDHDDRADKAQLLAEDGENVVVVLLGQVQIFLAALAEAEAHEAAGADGVERLEDLVAVVRWVGGRVTPGGDAAAGIALRFEIDEGEQADGDAAEGEPFELHAAEEQHGGSREEA